MTTELDQLRAENELLRKRLTAEIDAREAQTRALEENVFREAQRANELAARLQKARAYYITEHLDYLRGYPASSGPPTDAEALRSAVARIANGQPQDSARARNMRRLLELLTCAVPYGSSFEEQRRLRNDRHWPWKAPLAKRTVSKVVWLSSGRSEPMSQPSGVFSFAVAVPPARSAFAVGQKVHMQIERKLTKRAKRKRHKERKRAKARNRRMRK